MNRIEAMKLLSEIKHYLTAGNPVWDEDEIAEACDMAIEALRNEINCVKCEHYTERETPTGIKGVCKMDTAHREALIRRSDAIDAWWHDEVFFGNQRDDMTKEQWLDYITDVIGSLPSADLKKMVGCTGCEHYNQQQTALICHDCKRYYRDMYEDGEAVVKGADNESTL